MTSCWDAQSTQTGGVCTASHQPGSQDSILRDCPGGGGVSLNRTPLASLRVPGPKKLPPCGASARGRKLRSALSAVRRRTDIAGGGGRQAEAPEGGALLIGRVAAPLLACTVLHG